MQIICNNIAMDLARNIKKNGNRLTKQREVIIDALTSFSTPKTAAEIFTYLRKHQVRVDLVSIYRTLNLLSRIGVIHEFEFGEGKKRYEIMSEEKHHHHFVCESCGTVDQINIDEQKLIDQVSSNNTYTIRRHSLEFFGLCADCK